MHVLYKSLALVILWLCVATLSFAQRALPVEAKLATMIPVNYPIVMLNDIPVRLAPGIMIRNEQNLIILSGSLPLNQPLKVRYLLDFHGQLSKVWILNSDELARPENR